MAKVNTTTLRFPNYAMSQELHHVMKISIYSKDYKTSGEKTEESSSVSTGDVAAGVATLALDPLAINANSVGSAATAGLSTALTEAGSAKINAIVEIVLPIPENIVNNFTGNWTAYEPSWLDFLLKGDTEKALRKGVLTSLPGALGRGLKSVGRTRISISGTAKSISSAAATAGIQAGGSALQGVAGAFRSGMRQSGVTLNPYTALEFKAPNLRTFNFSWVLSPRNSAEASDLKKIIDTLNKYTLPKELETGNGAFFAWPEFCDIQFLSKGSDNTYLPIIHECAITGVSTKFDNKFHKDDSSPLSVVLSLSVMETVIFTQDAYDNVKQERDEDMATKAQASK